MTAMRRTFRNRSGLPWWYWRRLANRLKSIEANTEAPPEDGNEEPSEDE